METTRALTMKLAAIAACSAFLPQVSHAQLAPQDTAARDERVEWYDPADWFEEGELDDEYVDHDFYDSHWDGLNWYDTYNYYGVYGPDYEFDPVNNEWVLDTGDEYTDPYSRITELGQDSQQAQETATLEGTVEGFRKIDIEHSSGYVETHALARISLDDGPAVVVDLGLASLLDFNLEKGDEVTLRGSKGEIDGQTVFFAAEFKSGRDTVFIDRAIPMDQISGSEQGQSREGSAARSSGRSGQSGSSADATAQQGRRMTLEGEVDRMESVQLKGESEAQSFARIRLQSGEAATVGLGPDASLDDLDLKEGNRVRIQGVMKEIEGRDVLMARSISVEGETATEAQGSRSGSRSRSGS